MKKDKINDSLISQCKELNEAKKIGTYKDYKDLELGIFTKFIGLDIKKIDKNDNMIFQVPEKRKDNNECILYGMASYNELLKEGCSEEYLNHVIKIGIKLNRIRDIKNKLGIKNKNFKPIYYGEKERNKESYTVVECYKNKKKGFIKALYKKSFESSIFWDYHSPDNKRCIKIRSLIAKNTKNRVLYTTQDRFGRYKTIKANNKMKNFILDKCQIIELNCFIKNKKAF